LLAGLEAHIVQERGLGKVTFPNVAGVVNTLPPANKVQPVVSISPLATRTATATSANPIVMLIMRLLAAASVTNDRINFTPRASPQNNLGAARGPIRFELVRRSGKWDKQNRTSWRSAPALTAKI
jgi:hypothetical protein